MNEPSLRYSDERDKTYGIAGMTISLVACDGMDLLSEIHLDALPGECMVMTHDYGFKGNPRMSAKIVWSQTLKQLRTTAYMALGNIACRRYVLSRRALTDSDTAPIREALRGEAHEHCSLDTDEADTLFDNCMAQIDRIFRHATVHEAARSFAEQLASRRTLSADEAVEILARLGIR